MSSRASRGFAWSLWTLYVVLACLSLAIACYGATLPNDADVEPVWLSALTSLSTFVFATTGALVAARRPENPIGWVMCSISLAWTILAIAEPGAAVNAARPGSLPAEQALAWLNEWAVWPAFGLTAIFLLLFPDGRPLSPRWRPAGWLAAGGVVLSVLGAALRPDPLVGGIANPVGMDATGVLEGVRVTGAALLTAAFVAAVLSLLLRFRRAAGIERQQLKWLAYVVVAPLAVVLPLAAVDLSLMEDILWGATLFVLLVGIPITTALAVLRYRLYDIDRIIRRTLVYGIATAALAAVYFAVVLLLQQVFSSFAGGSDLAIAGSTLAAAALFRPVRARVQALVDRRFYRRKYHAERTLETFSARLRDEIDLDTLHSELVAVVEETMRPAGVSLWLRSER
jgi:hypothetical protein